MYVYEQSTGWLRQGPMTVARGWAGRPPFKNNPDGWRAIGVGPLPCGRYTIGAPYTHPLLGPVTMNLTPAPENDMAGRSAFRIHGASAEDTEFSSKGCIVLSRADREAIATSGDTELHVVRGDAKKPA